jgi:hypothetical protein
MGRAQTLGGCAGRSVRMVTPVSRSGALHGVGVEIGIVGCERGVRDWRRVVRGRHWTTDGNWGACRDTVVRDVLGRDGR